MLVNNLIFFQGCLNMNKMLLEGEEMLIFKQVRLLGKIITNNALLSYLKTHS